MMWISDYADIFTFVGFIVSVGALIFSIVITRIVHKTKKITQEPHKLNTQKNMKKISDYYLQIMHQCEDYDGDVYDESDNILERNYTINIDIKTYYQTNKEDMDSLLIRSQTELDLWLDIDKTKRNKYQQVIDDYAWLVKEFYRHSANDDKTYEIRVWSDNYDDMIQKKIDVENIISLK